MNAAASTRRDGHATGMAGEFFVMEKLFRLSEAEPKVIWIW